MTDQLLSKGVFIKKKCPFITLIQPRSLHPILRVSCSDEMLTEGPGCRRGGWSFLDGRTSTGQPQPTGHSLIPDRRHFLNATDGVAGSVFNPYSNSLCGRQLSSEVIRSFRAGHGPSWRAFLGSHARSGRRETPSGPFLSLPQSGARV